jgi:hypothetical protein
MQLGLDNIIRVPVKPIKLFNSAIQKLDRTDAVSGSVRYLVSACTAIEEMGYYNVSLKPYVHLRSAEYS